MQKCPLGCPYGRLKQMECPPGCPSSGQIRIKCPLRSPSTGKCVEVLSWVSFHMEKLLRYPRKVPFQWTKRGEVRIKVPYQCKNMFPSRCLSCGEIMVKCPSGHPSSGPNMIKCCPFNGQNQVECLSGCPSGGTYVKVPSKVHFTVPLQWRKHAFLRAFPVETVAVPSRVPFQWTKSGKVPYRGGLPVE